MCQGVLEVRELYRPLRGSLVDVDPLVRLCKKRKNKSEQRPKIKTRYRRACGCGCAALDTFTPNSVWTPVNVPQLPELKTNNRHAGARKVVGSNDHLHCGVLRN